MYEGPGAFPAHPAMAVGELLHLPRLEPSAYRRGALSPGVAEQAAKHAVEGAVARRHLQHFVDDSVARVVHEPAEQAPALDHRAGPQAAVTRLAGSLAEYP